MDRLIEKSCRFIGLELERVEIPLVRARVVEQAQQVPHAAFTQRHSEMLCGNFLRTMSFIENHMLVIRQDAYAKVAQSQVGEEQRMIAHEQIAVLHAPP